MKGRLNAMCFSGNAGKQGWSSKGLKMSSFMKAQLLRYKPMVVNKYISDPLLSPVKAVIQHPPLYLELAY